MKLLKDTRRTFYFGVMLLLGMGSPQLASAIPRASKEQMAKHTEEADRFWMAPGSNYNDICSRCIKPGLMSQNEVLLRLGGLLAASSNEFEKAAIHYLTGEAYYWGARTEALQTRDHKPILAVGNRVATAYLAAWDAIGKAATNSEAVKLRRVIAANFNALLSTAVCGGNLSTNVRMQVVERYIDQLSSADKLTVAWTTERRSVVFANLGILSRMAAEIPVEMPTTFVGVVDALTLAICSSDTNAALRFAVHLDECYEGDLDKSTASRRQVFNAYKLAGDARALPCIKRLALADPMAWLDVYEYGVRLDPKLSQEERRKCIAACLAGMEAAGRLSMDSYRLALERVVKMDDCALAVELAEQALGKGSLGPLDRWAYVWRLKAIAHDRLGQNEKAEEARRSAAQYADFVEGEDLQVVFRTPNVRECKKEKTGGVK